MTVAFGTSTPTSTTVVATRTSVSPVANARIRASFSSGASRPCRTSSRSPASGPVRSVLGDVEHRQRGPAVAAVVGRGAVVVAGLLLLGAPSPSSRSPIRGQTT